MLTAACASMCMLTLIPSAEAGFTEVRASTLKYNGTKYWRKKADEAALGSVGEKKSPIGSKNYFQHIQDAPAGIFKVSVGGTTTITSNQANKWSVSPAASNVSGNFGGSGSYKGTITAYKLKIDIGNLDGHLRYETNRNIRHLNALKALGGKGRLISAVWILVASQETKSECYSGDLQVTGNGWNVKTSASGCKDSTYTIQPGSIIAYEMVKADKWDNHEIVKPTSCPSGYGYYEVKKSITMPKDRCRKTNWIYTSIKCNLRIGDKASNWYVSTRSGKDTCKSRKRKPDRGVKCSKTGYTYVSKSGRDNCKKATYAYKDPTCPAGYSYDKKSTGNGGRDQCDLKGIDHLKVDNQDGF